MENVIRICTFYTAFASAGKKSNIRSVTNVQKENRVLVLSIVSVSWRKSFHSIDVHFGSQHESTQLERHDPRLKKRQDATTTASTGSGSSIQFPPTPSSIPTATRVADASVTTAWVGTTILPPTFPGADFIVPDLPLGLNVICKNCSMQGSIDLSHGFINMNNSQSTSSDPSSNDTDIDISDIIDFYQKGYVELTVNDFFAHIELESTVKPSVSLATYLAPFPDIGIPGWVIPHIAEVGPVLRPHVTFGVELSAELEFTYGFDLTIPNNSTIHIDINDPVSNSTVTGFQNTKFTPIPFQSQVDSVNLTVSAAFNPQLLLTFAILEDHGEISAGAFLDLPKLSATIAQVNHVDEKCNPANTSDKVADFLDNSLTNIVPKVDFDVGVLVQGSLDVPAYTTDLGATTTLAGTGYTLPTACISYDGKAKTYGAAAAANTKKSSAGERVRNPIQSLFSPSAVVVVIFALFWGARAA